MTAQSVGLFVNDGGLRGGPLRPGIADHPFVRAARTAPRYRFFSVRDEFPRCGRPNTTDVSVVGELYDAQLSVIRDVFLPRQPPELECGVVELEDGSSALVVLMRETAHASGDGLTDICDITDWRDYWGQETPTA